MTTVDVGHLLGTPLDESRALARAVELAHANARAGELPFGALVLRDGVVAGAGVNTSRSDLDPARTGR